MKLTSAAIALLSFIHCAHGLVSGPRPHSISGRASLHSTKLYSASFAAGSNLSVGNSVGLGINGGDNVAASSDGAAAIAATEEKPINYGPGELLNDISCVSV